MVNNSLTKTTTASLSFFEQRVKWTTTVGAAVLTTTLRNLG